MSAFIVTDETINKVVSYLYAKANGPGLQELGLSTVQKIGFDLSDFDNCRSLAEQMFDLNVAAVNARYGRGEAEKFRPLNFQFRFIPSQLIEVIKALETWSYQCTEGDIPDQRLYKAMQDLRCELYREAVHQLPEYEAAPWE